MKFTITVERAEEGAARINNLAVQLDRVVLQEAADELEAIGVFLEGEVKRRTPTDTGTLRASIYSELRISGQSLEELVSTPLVYGPPVEFGRKPGKMPPPDALRGWARRKLGDENLAFVVARAIAKKGTKERDIFQDAWNENLSRIQAMLDTIGVHVSADLLKNL